MSGQLTSNLPLVFVAALSLVTGLVMVVVVRYTSDQRAIYKVKDEIKAHLLAVRIYQDQLPVVLRSYCRVLNGIIRYVRLAIMPFLCLVLPLILLIGVVDEYLLAVPFRSGQSFLVKVYMTSAHDNDIVFLRLPSEMEITAPPVHISDDNEIVWRVIANKDGNYDVDIGVNGQLFEKSVVVSSSRIARLSPARVLDGFWSWALFLPEPRLPRAAPVRLIAVNYPARSIHCAGLDWNWLWLYLALSGAAGFVFKTILGIEI